MPPPPPHRPLSGVTLGLGLPAPTPEASGVDAPATPDARYEDGGLLGAGGMGEVRAAHDTVLDRTVALKAPLRGDPSASTRLMGEATLTARLSHPGIPPVFDAGSLPDGRAFYTMPVIEGRSLADAIHEAAGADGRLRLVRHLLDAADAIAYAHSRGVLHRDLKPSNIMVGAFGRTLVVDWGVAGPTGVRALAADGRSLGTPGFMPPEQQRGEPLGPQADVYALGATLLNVITGEAPRGGRAADGLAGAPPELLAIAVRARATDPAQRYPDARALADDLTAWFEGRRVAAHHYTLAELARRAWDGSRGVIVASMLALLGVGVATAVGVARTAAQRDRATLAEGRAVEALSAAELNLAEAQLARALDALREGDRCAAELLAATALTRLDSPEARGVLAAFDPADRPRLVGRWPLGQTRDVTVSSAGTWVLHEREEGWYRSTVLPDGSLSSTALPDVARARPIGESGRYLTSFDHQLHVGEVDGSLTPLGNTRGTTLNLPFNPTPNRAVWLTGSPPDVVDLDTGVGWRVSFCAGVGTAGEPRIRADGAMYAVCMDGKVERWPLSFTAPREHVVRLDFGDDPPLVLGNAQDAAAPLAVRTRAGHVHIFDPRTGARLQTLLGEPMAWTIETSLNERLVLSRNDRVLRVFDWRTGGEVAALPGEQRTAVLREGGAQLRTVAQDIEDWALPPGTGRPHVRTFDSGITHVAISPDGTRFASAHGDGRVRIGRLDSTQLLFDQQVDPSVVKDIAFSPESDRVVAVFAGRDDLALIDLHAPEPLRYVPAQGALRVVWLRGGVVIAPYLGGLLHWRDPADDAPPTRIESPIAFDLRATRDTTAAFFTPRSGPSFLLTFDPEPTLTPMPSTEGWYGVSGDARLQVLNGRGGITIHVDGEPRGEVPAVGSTYTRAIVSPDGTRFATARQDGSIAVWSIDPLVELAWMPGHGQRATSIAFDQSGRWLLSGGWDGAVMRWSLDALDRDPDALLAEIEAAWGRDAEDVLRARRRQ